MKYSIVVVTYNRQKELFNCLESIVRSSSPFKFEVIVVFNGDRAYMERCSQTYKNFQMIFINKTTPSNARNTAIKVATGEYLFFLDDDCVLPANYFSQINFDRPWDVLGGPDQTPLVSTPFQSAIGKALSSPLCMGPTYKRHTLSNVYDTEANEQSLILCNLWFRNSLFKVEGYKFNNNLFRNEENYLLKELKNNNKIIHYNPNLYVYHQRKQGLEKLGAAIIKSGECRIQNFSLLPQTKEIFYLLPLIWTFLFFLMIFHPQLILISAFAAYTFIIIIHYLINYKSFSVQYIFLHYFILTTYSIGLFKGLIKFSSTLYNNLKENRSFIKESRSK
jgi:glycosyltransferase involved in cell wall biosynthesis